MWRRNEAKLKEVAAAVESAGGQATAIACDVTNDDSVKEMVAKAAEALGGIDVFMNIAGITLEKAIEDAEPDDFRRASWTPTSSGR